jgi:hypothetical protein
MHYLRDGLPVSKEGAEKLRELLDAFETRNDGKTGRLENNHSQAAYLEFGIGIIGGRETHALVDGGVIDWEYDVPSKYKERAAKLMSEWNSGNRELSLKTARRIGGLDFDGKGAWFHGAKN